VPGETDRGDARHLDVTAHDLLSELVELGADGREIATRRPWPPWPCQMRPAAGVIVAMTLTSACGDDNAPDATPCARSVASSTMERGRVIAARSRVYAAWLRAH
jgi:hypothetical protein